MRWTGRAANLRGIRVGLAQDLRMVTAEAIARIGNRLPEVRRKALAERAQERLKPRGLQPEP